MFPLSLLRRQRAWSIRAGITLTVVATAREGEAHDDIENEEEMRDSLREMPMPELREKLIRLGFSREGCIHTHLCKYQS